MSYTVWSAFDSFRHDKVDLDSDVSAKAKTSRDYLFEQIKSLSSQDVYFPNVLSYISFGSFARKTRIRPLKDIDFMPLMNGRGTSCYPSSTPYIYLLKIDDRNAPLANFDNGYGYVNSTKVLNKLKSLLSSVRNYRKADLKKSMQTIVLDLISYAWVFDIVPSVEFFDWQGNTAFYLIPDGKGNWIKTNPKVDQINITRVNQWHNKNFIPIARLLKYWNGRIHKPVLKSYYFETIATKAFDYSIKISDYQSAVKYFFSNCSSHILNSCQDPKGLGQNLDLEVSYEIKQKVINAVTEAKQFAEYALMYESQSKHKEAIYWWQRVFGSEFPDYG